MARNWRAGRLGEIDLVAVRDGTIAVCEVKTRSSAAFGTAAEAITPAKAARLRRLAAAWLAETGARGQVRFDVVAITAGQVEVITDAL